MVKSQLIVMFVIPILSLTQGVTSIVCPEYNSSVYEMKSATFNYFGYTTSIMYQVKFGRISNDIYMAGHINNGLTYTFVQKSESDLTSPTYIKFYSWSMGGKTLEVDQHEDYIYNIDVSGAMIRMMQANATNGALTNAFESNLGHCTDYATTIVENDNDILYVNLANGTSGILCSVDITVTPWTLQCFEITGYFHFTGMVPIDSEHLFYEAIENTGANRGHLFQLVDFNDNSVEWSWRMNCTIASCTPHIGHAVLSDNNSIIWTAYTMDSVTGQFGFIALNADDGSIYNNIKFTADTVASMIISGMILLSDAIYITICPGTPLMTVYDMTQSRFKVYQMSLTPYSLHASSLSNQIIASGTAGTISSVSLFTSESIPFNSEIVLSSHVFYEMPSSGYDYFTYSVSIGALVSGIMTAISPSLTESFGLIDTATLVEFESEAYFIEEAYEHYDLLENSNVTLHLELTCTPSGTTAISSILSDYEGNILPSWVSLDNSTGELFVQTPGIDESTNYTFSVLTNVDNISRDFYKPVYLGVNPCTIDQCQQCNSTQASQCLHCAVGYSVVSGVCQEDIVEQPVEDEELVKTVTTTTLGSLVASTGMIIVSASISASSIIGAWSLFNQIQMLILILLMHANIPKAISDFLSGMDFSMFSFNSLLSGDGNQLSKFLSWIGGEQSSEELRDTGVEYSSSISNNFSMLLIMLVALILIVSLYALIKWMNSKRDSYPKTFKFFKYTQRFLIYSIMLRLFLQSNQFFLLTSMSEVGEWEYSEARKVISSLFAMALAILNTAAILVTLNCWYKARKSIAWTSKEFEKHLFDGLLMKSSARLYPMLLLLRRYILILFLTQLVCNYSNFRPEICVGFVCFVTVPYTVILFTIRPFVKNRDNIVEIVNEIYFVLFVCILFYFNTSDRWAMVSNLVFLFEISL